MSETSSSVCLRCGDFLAEKPAAPGVALCRPCFEPRALLPDPVITLAPAWTIGTFALVCFLVDSLGALAGAIVGLRLGLEIRDAAIAGAVAIGLLALSPPVFAAINAAFDRAWRRAVAAEVGLAGTAFGSLPFVLWTSRLRGWLELFGPEDVGLLLEGPSALAIFGRRGGRPVVALGDVVHVALGRHSLFNWSFAVRLDRRDGSHLWLAVRSGVSFRQSRRLTRELADRLRARIEAAPA